MILCMNDFTDTSFEASGRLLWHNRFSAGSADGARGGSMQQFGHLLFTPSSGPMTLVGDSISEMFRVEL
jgi:hypothetical protein